MTVHVQAGIRLDDLQAELGEQGQWLPYDPARTEATIGGLLASGDAGPRRLAYGTLRDLVIGAPRWCSPTAPSPRAAATSSRTSPAMTWPSCATARWAPWAWWPSWSLRVHPLPQTSRTVAVRDVDSGQAQRLAWLLTRSATEPTAIEWCEPEQLLLVALRRHQRRRRRPRRRGTRRPVRLAGRARRPRRPPRCGSRTPARIVAEPGDTVLRAATRPGVDPGLTRSLAAWAEAAGVKALLTCSPAIGGYTVRVTGGDAKAHAEVVKNWRTSVESVGGFVTLRRRRPGVDSMVESWGRAPSAVEVMRRVKGSFDPEGRFAPGRFMPWF